jgi:hypothetical protein
VVGELNAMQSDKLDTLLPETAVAVGLNLAATYRIESHKIIHKLTNDGIQLPIQQIMDYLAIIVITFNGCTFDFLKCAAIANKIPEQNFKKFHEKLMKAIEEAVSDSLIYPNNEKLN